MSRHYILVDFENTQLLTPQNLSGLSAKLVIFVGKVQKHIPVELAKRLLQCQCEVELYESAGAGKNALDFQLAFYAGRIFEKEPEANIHIVSRDKGFDPLVEHIKDNKRICSRVDSFNALPFLKSTATNAPKEKYNYNALSTEQKVQFVIQRLSKMAANTRPRKVNSLMSSLISQFSKQLPEKEISEIIDRLIQKEVVIKGENGGVSYRL